MKITLAHTPDSDDAFMFYGLKKGLVDTKGYEFEHVLVDIQTLNEEAHKERYDVTALSMYGYCFVADKYALLATGASMGDGYGPRLVGSKKYTREELRHVKIAVPGKRTSAFLALQLYLGTTSDKLNTVIVPFDQIFEALKLKQADVGLIIHEGQITYAEEGFELSEDLGQWWWHHTGGLPLPLGTNAVRRKLGEKVCTDIQEILRESIVAGLNHRQAAVDHSLPYGRGINRDQADKFIGMYVNDLTVNYGERGRAGVREFLSQGFEMGLLPAVDLEFVGSDEKLVTL